MNQCIIQFINLTVECFSFVRRHAFCLKDDGGGGVGVCGGLCVGVCRGVCGCGCVCHVCGVVVMLGNPNKKHQQHRKNMLIKL